MNSGLIIILTRKFKMTGYWNYNDKTELVQNTTKSIHSLLLYSDGESPCVVVTGAGPRKKIRGVQEK